MIAELDEAHIDALARFFDRLPDGDVTFIKEDLGSDSLRAWLLPGRGGWRWVATDDPTGDDHPSDHEGEVIGFAALLPLSGWSSHVGELRLAVAEDRRGAGIGRRLAQVALHHAVTVGLHKVTVEVVAAQAGTVAMFNKLGFTAEAMLEDHIRDRQGDLQDLLVLAHRTDEGWSAVTVAGIDDALSG